MSTRSVAATAARVLAQLRRDARTVALVFIVPCVLLTLLKYLFDGQPETFDRIGVPLVGLFPFLQLVHRQLLLCGLFVPRERMASALETLAGVLPASYAYDALDRLANHGGLGARGTVDAAVVLALTVLALVLGAATLRRATT